MRAIEEAYRRKLELDFMSNLHGRELVDRHLIADRLGVPIDTVDKWRQRRVLPDPDFPQLRNPVWEWETIREWAENTGRLAGGS